MKNLEKLQKKNFKNLEKIQKKNLKKYLKNLNN